MKRSQTSSSPTPGRFAPSARPPRRTGASPGCAALIQSWGGVTIAYRKRLIDSPMYRLNPEEVEFALQEGFRFAECLSPALIETDDFGAARAIRFEMQMRDEDGRWQGTGETLRLPARTVLMAAGTTANSSIARDEPASLALDGDYFPGGRRGGRADHPGAARQARDDGDLHGPARRRTGGELLRRRPSGLRRQRRQGDGQREAGRAPGERAHQRPGAGGRDGRCRLHGPDRGRPARHRRAGNPAEPPNRRACRQGAGGGPRLRPGPILHGCRISKGTAPHDGGGPAAFEGLALAGAWADPEAGLIGAVVVEAGGSGRLAATLAPGEPVVFMGPTRYGGRDS